MSRERAGEGMRWDSCFCLYSRGARAADPTLQPTPLLWWRSYRTKCMLRSLGLSSDVIRPTWVLAWRGGVLAVELRSLHFKKSLQQRASKQAKTKFVCRAGQSYTSTTVQPTVQHSSEICESELFFFRGVRGAGGHVLELDFGHIYIYPRNSGATANTASMRCSPSPRRKLRRPSPFRPPRQKTKLLQVRFSRRLPAISAYRRSTVRKSPSEIRPVRPRSAATSAVRSSPLSFRSSTHVHSSTRSRSESYSCQSSCDLK